MGGSSLWFLPRFTTKFEDGGPQCIRKSSGSSSYTSKAGYIALYRDILVIPGSSSNIQKWGTSSINDGCMHIDIIDMDCLNIKNLALFSMTCPQKLANAAFLLKLGQTQRFQVCQMLSYIPAIYRFLCQNSAFPWGLQRRRYKKAIAGAGSHSMCVYTTRCTTS